jgi:hypothetical protein
MLRKLVFAGALAAAGVGQVPAAHAATAQAAGDPVVAVYCVGPIFEAQRNEVTLGGELTGLITASGDAISNVVHGQDTSTWYYNCANGAMDNIGNTNVQSVRR